MPLFLLCLHAFFPHTSSAEIFHSLQQEPQAQQFKKGVFLRCWGVHDTLRGLILQVQAMIWHSLLQEAERATPPHMDWGSERHPLATETPIPLQNQIAKPSKCVRALRALMSLNGPEDHQLGPVPTPTGPRPSYRGRCCSSTISPEWTLAPCLYLGWTKSDINFHTHSQQKPWLFLPVSSRSFAIWKLEWETL